MLTRPIVIAATIPGHIFRQPDARLWSSWLTNQGPIRYSHAAPGVRYFLSLEQEGADGGQLPQEFVDAMDDVWAWSLQDGRTESTTENRQRHIVYGQNLAAEYALEHRSDLFMVGSSVTLPPDVIPGMGALWNATLLNFQPIMGPYVAAYNQAPGKHIQTYGNVDFFRGMPAGAMLVPHYALKEGLRWRTHSGMSDDFTLQIDAERYFGTPSFVSMSTPATKYPASVIPLEQRGYDRRTA